MNAKIKTLKSKLETLNAERQQIITGVKFVDRDREAYTAKSQEIAELEKIIIAEELKEEIKSVNSFNNRVWGAWQEIREYKGDIFKADGSHTKKFSDFLQPIRQKYDVHVYAKYWSSGAEYKFSENTQNNRNSRSIYTENAPTENLPELKFSEVMKARKQHNKYVEELEKLQNKINENFQIATGRYDLKSDDRKYKFSHI